MTARDARDFCRTTVRCWLAGITRHDRRWREAVMAIALMILAAQWIRLFVNPAGDLQNHRVFAQRLVSGSDLYAGGLDVPYTPFWATAHVPATWLPARSMPAVLFPIGVAAVGILIGIMDRLCRSVWPVDERTAFWVAVGSIVLVSRFLLRDLLDAGENAEIVALTWGGIYLWSSDHWRTAGVFLGLAIALKLTAVAFVAYFAWKRQWHVAAWSLGAAILFTLTPAFWMGWNALGTHLQVWAGTLVTTIRRSDPRIGVLGLESVQNISLRPALARFLTHIPPGLDGQGRFVHPLNVDVLTLSPPVADVLVGLVFAAATGTAMYLTRKALASPRDPRAIWECAGVSVAALLFSPITWRSHAVAILPAAYLILRTAAAGGVVLPSARIAVAMLIVSSLILSRGLAGSTVSGLVHAYYLFTWTFLVLAISMWRSAEHGPYDRCAHAAD